MRGKEIIKDFKDSIGDVKAYERFTGMRLGRSLSYFLIICTIFGLLSLARPVISYLAGVNVFISEYQKNVPEFKLENGKLELSNETDMPIMVESDGMVLVIDTREAGGEGRAKADEYDNYLLVTSDSVVQKQYGMEREYRFSDFQDLELSKESVAGFLPLLRWVSVLILLFGLVAFAIGWFIQALLVSIIALIASKYNNAGLSYNALLSISIHSITLPILIRVFMDLAAINLNFSGLFLFAAAAFYSVMAVKSIASQKGEGYMN